ncbi:MAG TPA: ABC transporter permease [Verrucomicrobiae bacterium]
MKTLIEKEIRLLLPAFVGALVLAIVPIWLQPYDRWEWHDYSAYFFLFGVALLSLSSLGREIGFKTLSLMLAQPMNRLRLWRTKAVVLGIFTVLVFEGWWLSGRLITVVRPVPPQAVGFVGVFVAVLYASGLWLTLLLRQVAAAFWLTMLIPVALFGAIKLVGASDSIALVVLGVYAVAGFLLARRQFITLQDSAWTGGVVTFSGRTVAEGSVERERRPWAALIRKELQLQEFTLAGIIVLIVLHIGVVVLRKLGADAFNRTTREALELFGVVWLFVPLMAGSQSIADERQLGTHDGLLSLPVSRAAQFAVKLIVVLVIGGLLSGALMYGVEAIGNRINASAHLDIMGLSYSGGAIVRFFSFFLTLSLIGFYASSLTKSIVQSLAVGVTAALVFWAPLTIAPRVSYLFGYKLWPAIAFPVFILTVLYATFGNFRYLFESGKQWRRNIFTWLAVTFLIYSSSAAIYMRVWEYAMPLEGAHGAARLPEGKPVALRGNGWGGLGIVLPDGRLWTYRPLYTHDPVTTKIFLPSGSNWLEVAPLERETVGIRGDGTLWLSDKDGRPFAQFGAETNWQSLAARGSASASLLKRDGSLWYWGTNSVNWKNFPGLGAMAPERDGSDSDWARIMRGARSVFAWKRNGEAWALHHSDEYENWGNERLPGLDHVQFLSLNRFPVMGDMDIGLRDDGTLWHWKRWKDSKVFRYGYRPGSNDLASPDLVQFGKGAHWMAVSSQFYDLLALKSDGSLWRWEMFHGISSKPDALANPPERLGVNQDWLGLAEWKFKNAALAADGSIWAWPSSGLATRYWEEDMDHWLMPSIRPVRIANILDHVRSTNR